MDLSALGNLDIQQLLDTHVNARYAAYGRAVYVPQDKTAEDVSPEYTHALQLVSRRTGQMLMIAIEGKLPYTALLDIGLAVV